MRTASRSGRVYWQIHRRPPSKNASKIIDMMRLHNLTAVNTFYQPRRDKTTHTFLHTKRNDDADDAGMYVGRKVKCKYRDKWIHGEVTALKWTQGTPMWVVHFEDDYVTTYAEAQLKKILIHAETEKSGHQIDYICVSHRWLSCVQGCTVKWAPSIHRDSHGEKNDHELVESVWKWRIRSPKPEAAKDFSVLLDETYDTDGKKVLNKYLVDFDEAVCQKLRELHHEQATDAATMHSNMNATIGHAVDSVLPEIKRTKGVKHKVSAETKKLYERRANMQGSTHAQYDEINKEIRDAGLRDFRDWVKKEHSEKMSVANGQGDTRAIHKSVRVLAGKQQKPATNLTTDGMGHVLGSAREVASRWTEFLAKKFAVTQAEEIRPAMRALAPTVGQGQLTRKEILDGLSKMSNGKATGPDDLPIEVFKVSPTCQELLIQLLQTIWRDEIVPTYFAQAKFIPNL